MVTWQCELCDTDDFDAVGEALRHLASDHYDEVMGLSMSERRRRFLAYDGPIPK